MISCDIILSIAVPTFNRCEYLKELLPQIISQCNQIDTTSTGIELVICDNASTDQTAEYIKNLILTNPRISYYRNNKNIGGDANFINCVTVAKGKYVWLFGDDELLTDGGISKVMNVLKEHTCSLIIVKDESPPKGFIHSELFDNYETLVNHVAEINPHFVLAHTLITSNIFLKDVFDIDCAYRYISTNYGHMYGLMNKLKSGGEIYYCNNPIIIVRKRRAKFEKYPKLLILKQTQYIRHIGKVFNNKEIVRFSYIFLLKDSCHKIRSLIVIIFIWLPKKIIKYCSKLIN
jgi:abequosyltransferase